MGKLDRTFWEVGRLGKGDTRGGWNSLIIVSDAFGCVGRGDGGWRWFLGLFGKFGIFLESGWSFEDTFFSMFRNFEYLGCILFFFFYISWRWKKVVLFIDETLNDNVIVKFFISSWKEGRKRKWERLYYNVAAIANKSWLL